MTTTTVEETQGGGLPLSRAWMVAALAVYLALVAAGWWAASRFLPDRIAVEVFGRVFDVENLRHRIASDGALVFLILPAAFWIECLVVGWRDCSFRRLLLHRTASMKTDIAYFIAGEARIAGLLGKLMTFGLATVSGLWLHDWLKATFGLAVDITAAPVPLQVLAYFYVYSFFDYWTHRLDHTKWFWPLHRFHHAASDFCVITAGRTHPAAFTAIFIINMPMAALGATPEIMITVNVLVISLGFLIHSRIDSNFGWIGRWVIQSPNHHRLHHSLDWTTVPTGHFAQAPIWDHLFGTWRGEADQTLPIGVDTPYRHGWWIGHDLVRDYWDFLKSLSGGLLSVPAKTLTRLRAVARAPAA